MRVALVYVPFPKHPLLDAERRYSSAFFQVYAKTHFKHLSPDALKHLWEVEKINHGLLYIASYLMRHNFEISYYAYGSNPYTPDSDGLSFLINKILMDIERLDLVCIYSITCNYHLAKSIAARLKSKRPEIIIGLGGPHATATPYQVLDEGVSSNSVSFHKNSTPPFDFVGIGEGEETVLALARCIRDKGHLEAVPGTVIRTKEGISIGPIRKRANPVKFPIPAYELAAIEQLPAARIFPNRGCPNRCAFCADPWNKEVTYLTLDSIAKEVDILYSKYGTRYLYLGCEDFLCDEERAMEIAEVIHRTRPEVSWSAQCRAKPDIKAKAMKTFVRCGCVGLEFGVESACQPILDRINKNIHVEDAKKCFEIVKSYGLYSHAYWMLGLPGEGLTSAEKTINTMLEWGYRGLVDTWEYKIYIPYPNTPIYNNPEYYKIQIHTKDYRLYHYALSPVISSNGLGPMELKSIYQKGLEQSADLLRTKIVSEEVELGIDLETIENMF